MLKSLTEVLEVPRAGIYSCLACWALGLATSGWKGVKRFEALIVLLQILPLEQCEADAVGTAPELCQRSDRKTPLAQCPKANFSLRCCVPWNGT